MLRRDSGTVARRRGSATDTWPAALRVDHCPIRVHTQWQPPRPLASPQRRRFQPAGPPSHSGSPAGCAGSVRCGPTLPQTAYERITCVWQRAGWKARVDIHSRPRIRVSGQSGPGAGCKRLITFNLKSCTPLQDLAKWHVPVCTGGL